MEPASIRFNNPGAMWGKGNKIALRWGSTGTTALADGLGQGNNIAFFPTKVQGACAQFDLWRTGYLNMTLEAADKKWSGGNSSPAYLNFLCQHVPSLTPSTIITTQILASPVGWKLMKYQAQWEAGQPYPMVDSDWQLAQKKVFSQMAPLSARQKKSAAAGAVVASTGVVAVKAASSGHHWGIIFAILFGGGVAAALAWAFVHFRHEKLTAPPAPPTLTVGGK